MKRLCLALVLVLLGLPAWADGFDSAGTYTAPSNSWNPAVTGTPLDPTDWNETLQDLEDGLTDLAVQPVGKWVPAGEMVARTTNGCAAGSAETTTNDVMVITFDCDASTDEAVQFNFAFPTAWNEGTITAQLWWAHPSTTTNFDVVWGVQCMSLSNDDALDTAFGSAQTVTDTGGTTDDVYVTSVTSAITCAGTPAAGDITYFQIYRDADNGSDTLAVDAKLLGVRIVYSINGADD